MLPNMVDAAVPADDAPRSREVFRAVLDVSLATPADATVGSAIIHGGKVQGELAGVVSPGSLAWTRDPVRGVLQLETRFELLASGGTRIHVADSAIVATPAGWESAFTTTPELTVQGGSPSACPESVYVGLMDASQIRAGRLRLSVHRVL